MQTDGIRNNLQLATGLVAEVHDTLSRTPARGEINHKLQRARALVDDALEQLDQLPGERPREAALVARFTDLDEFVDELERAIASGRSVHGPVRITKRTASSTALAGAGIARVQVVAGALLDDDVLVRLETPSVGELGWNAEKDAETIARGDELVAKIEQRAGELELDTAAGVYLWAGERQ